MCDPRENPGIYHPTDSGGYVECDPKFLLRTEQQVLDLLAVCGENGTNRLLVHSESLPDDFYDLHTGFAGMVLLKMSNYRIILAVDIPRDRLGNGRFYEMVLETNRGREFRVFSTSAEAIDWLLKI